MFKTNLIMYLEHVKRVYKEMFLMYKQNVKCARKKLTSKYMFGTNVNHVIPPTKNKCRLFSTNLY